MPGIAPALRGGAMLMTGIAPALRGGAMSIARLVLPALFALACSDVTTELIPRLDNGGGARDAEPADSAVRPTTACGDHACQCNNGGDDDGDTLTDGLDPECTGPFDDDEGSFATGMPDGDLPFCQDCYWDHDTSSEDDGCLYHDSCLTGGTPSGTGAPACASCEVSASCVSTCERQTPNGCDCFGCCAVRKPNGDVVEVVLSPECAVNRLNDETLCPRCTMNASCKNDCGRCELCPGWQRKHLPSDCGPPTGEPVNVCDNGEVCSATEPCPTDYYCLLGCCQYIVQ
jgi:hypothetical protein